MRKIIAITHVTLDGVMQAPGGPEEDPRGGFTQGGWSAPYRSEAGMKLVHEIMAGPFDLLLGGWTYRLFASYWPAQGDDPIGRAFNRATKYVVTRGQAPLGWEKSVRVAGEIAGELLRLKASEGPDLHVWGSGELLRTLYGAGLVDEHRLWVFPVVLGRGRRLFADGIPPGEFALVESRPTPTGVLLATYRPRPARAG